MCEVTEDIPLVNRDSITGFFFADNGKFKGTCNESISVRKANPLVERY